MTFAAPTGLPMRLTDLDFALPTNLIAQTASEPRDSARLLVYTRKSRAIAHHTVADLPQLLPAQSLLVANDTRVRKSRIEGTRKTGKAVEILLLTPVRPGVFEAMLRGSGIQPKEVLTLKDGRQVTVEGTRAEADFTTYLLDFQMTTPEVEQLCAELGSTPLPPYIQSADPGERYQTTFAQKVGSAAAPTAGLHFTPTLLERLRQAGIDWETVTLEVGIGTFQPLRTEALEENRLHRESTFVTPEAAEHINQSREAGHPLIAVGTTTCRTLESHTRNGIVQSGELSTDLFIQPGYEFKTAHRLLTNFHLPKSSLLALVAALIGTDAETGLPVLTPEESLAELRRIYAIAIAEQYRFFSFGDAMLVL